MTPRCGEGSGAGFFFLHYVATDLNHGTIVIRVPERIRIGLNSSILPMYQSLELHMLMPFHLQLCLEKIINSMNIYSRNFPWKKLHRAAFKRVELFPLCV